MIFGQIFGEVSQKLLQMYSAWQAETDSNTFDNNFDFFSLWNNGWGDSPEANFVIPTTCNDR